MGWSFQTHVNSIHGLLFSDTCKLHTQVALFKDVYNRLLFSKTCKHTRVAVFRHMSATFHKALQKTAFHITKENRIVSEVGLSLWWLSFYTLVLSFSFTKREYKIWILFVILGVLSVFLMFFLWGVTLSLDCVVLGSYVLLLHVWCVWSVFVGRSSQILNSKQCNPLICDNKEGHKASTQTKFH